MDIIGKVQKAVEHKERLVNRLDELLRSEISHAISNGISSNETIVETDSEWYGKIPDGWELVRLKYLTERSTPIVYGIVQPGPDQENGIPYIKGGECDPEHLDPDALSKTSPEIADRYQRSRLNQGDIVYEIRGSLGGVVKVPPELEGANLTQDTAKISPRPDINSDWLLYALRSDPFYQQMELKKRGAAVEGVNIFDLRRGVVPVPPLQEQRKIAEYLSTIDTSVRIAKKKINNSISVINQYRKSATSSIVTGQVDNTTERQVRIEPDG